MSEGAERSEHKTKERQMRAKSAAIAMERNDKIKLAWILDWSDIAKIVKQFARNLDWLSIVKIVKQFATEQRLSMSGLFLSIANY